MSSKLPQELTVAHINHLTPSGLGVATVHGRRTRIANSLPHEEVEFRYLRRHRGGDDGLAVRIVDHAHHERSTPHCPHFGHCGGCNLQHLAHHAQINFHQEQLKGWLTACGAPQHWLNPITDNSTIYGYRRKARLGVKFLVNRDTVLVGFRERNRSLIAEINSCAVLHPAVGTRILELRRLIYTLAARHAIPQLEVAAGEDGIALIFRHTEPLSTADRELLMAFEQAHAADHLWIFLQPGGLNTINRLNAESSTLLSYYLPKYQVNIYFQPYDFTQINFAINRAMLDQAITLLDLIAGETVLELYCGLGNFSLPLVRCGARVIGIEGDSGLVSRARDNAQNNALNAIFIVHDLNQGLPIAVLSEAVCAKALIDPPRSGAAAVLADLAALNITKIVYVSCNPETLARDALELVQRYGYKLAAAGVIDMFPHTGHMEAMAVFDR